MIVSYIKNLQNVFEKAQNESLSAELNCIFNESARHLPLAISAFIILRQGQTTEFYRLLQKKSELRYSKNFKNQTLIFEYDIKTEKENQATEIETTLLLDLVALYLNERVDHYFEKEAIEDFLKDQNEESAALIRMFCHDLVNPLSILNMSMEFLEDADEDKKFSSILNRMKKSSEALFNIIQSIRELNSLQGRRKNLTLEMLSLNDIFEECKKSFQDELNKKQIQLTLKLPQDKDVHFLADRQTFLNYIFNNLISNAIKFSRDHSRVELAAEKIADQLVLSIVDHGIGMNDQQLAKIFKFDKAIQRLGTHGEAGHGFGLQFCRYALKLHGFKLQISSQESKTDDVPGGTTVKLTIPLSA